MSQPQDYGRQLQAIEDYLQRLVASLKRGELPINLRAVGEVFDGPIADVVQPLQLPLRKFVAIYNDVPTLFAAYAIDATLGANSYEKENSRIVLERMYRGNYWIIPLAQDRQQAWLVPNPFKKLTLDRHHSLKLCFEVEGDENAPGSFSLLQPAQVEQLPTMPTTWQLVSSGQLSTYGYLSVPAKDEPRLSIEQLVNQLVDERLQSVGWEAKLGHLGEKLDSAKQQTAALIDRVRSGLTEEDGKKKEGGLPIDSWKKSLSDFIAARDDRE
jgi:hypothetical protein